MRLTSHTLQALAWSSIAFPTVSAQYIVDNLSFGHKDGSFNPNRHEVPNWHVSGENDLPQIFSDRVILTPGWPGNRRGALWSDHYLQHGEWTAEMSFRVSGPEHGNGNLQVWYVKEAERNVASIYTTSKFDGLVLVIDQYEGRGGSIRGFLNDGTKSIKDHHDPDMLAFAQCNYHYRNLGRLSTLKISQAAGFLTVTIDGNTCFRTDKVRLPTGYHFGISAASSGDPDSFEAHKFTVSTTNSHTREEPGYAPPPVHHEQQHWEQQPTHNRDDQSHHYEYHDEHHNEHHNDHQTRDEKLMADVIAATITAHQDQFEDLHNRVQYLGHKIEAIYSMMEQQILRHHDRHTEVMDRTGPIHDRTDAMQRNIEKIERMVMGIQRDLESKDYKDTLAKLNKAIEDSHNSLTQGLPAAMDKIVKGGSPKWTTFLFIAVAVQVMVLGGYLVYKKRRNSAPKKYL